MADMTATPTSDDPIVRLTDTLRGMHDRVSAQDDISKITEALLLLIRAILSYLARTAASANAPQPTIEPTIEPTSAPTAKTRQVRPRKPTSRARTARTRIQARQSISHGRRARWAHPPIHRQTIRTQARTVTRAPLLPDLPHTVAKF